MPPERGARLRAKLDATRMPVLLGLGDFAGWLNPSTVPADLLSLLRPAPDDALTATPVSAFVNSARHEGPGCVAPLKEPSPPDHPERPKRHQVGPA
jgi:hypothetical protein